MEEKLLKEEERSKEKSLQPNFSFPRALRIRKTFEFKIILSHRQKLYGKYINLDFRTNKNISYSKLGITISSKIAKAFVRNKFKRIIREVFRLNQSFFLKKNLEINISAKYLPENLRYRDIEKDFLNLIQKIK